MKKHVLIVGAGLAGMTSALILAKHGFEVTLLEQAKLPGHTLRGFYRRGVYFDTGLHYTGGLGENGPLLPYMRFLGADTLPVVSFDRHETNTLRFTESGNCLSLPSGFEALRETLTNAFPHDAQAVHDYMHEAREAYQSSRFLSFANGFQQPEYPLHWNESLAAYLHTRTANEELRTALSFHCLLHGVSPQHVSFLQHARVAASFFDGAHTYEGGGNALVQRLLNLLQQAGVTLVCDALVTRLSLAAAGTLAGAALADGRQFTGSHVVYTGHPAFLPDILPADALRPVYRKRLAELKDTVSAHILFGISDTPLPALTKKNLYIAHHGSFESGFAPGRKPEQGPFYITSPPVETEAPLSRKIGVAAFTTGDIAPLQQWAASTRKDRPKAYVQYKQDALQRFQDALCTACPELSSVRFVDGATPLTLREYLHTPSGGLYGAAHTLSQFNPLPITKIPNLLLAGQAVVAPGIIGVVLSAFLACGFLVGHDVLQAEVSQCL